ncbi:MAG TPA: hypothetical protein VFT62_08070 [Mycobacteriales bacterium]|nr:hypothetical protein [Mycobacteriales bacterium]
MYVWIWRHLPGGFLGKAFGSLVLFLGVAALLFFVVFPWIEPRLPFNDVTVDQSPSHSSSAPASPAH